jgi:putative tryptophan/tyrosine transport system substrate-binding protein
MTFWIFDFRFWIRGGRRVKVFSLKRISDSCSDKRPRGLKSKIKNLKSVGFVTLMLALTMCSAVAEAQQAAKIPRIGYLTPLSAPLSSSRVEAFRQRLRELGYVEGKNIFIEYRYADGKLDRLTDLAVELVQLKVEIIVTGGPGILAAKKASPTISIVFGSAGDPVGAGIVSSLARPGGNITGLSNMSPDLDGKRLELLKEAYPKVVRVAFLWIGSSSRGTPALTAIDAPAKSMGLKLQSLDVRSIDDFENAFAQAKRDSAQALLTTPGPLIDNQRRQVLDFAAKNRLPAMYPYSEFVEAGGLMSYSANYADLFRRAADFVDKILKGAKPADLPVEQPMKFEFLVNLKTAKQIGLTIPPNVLARADRVIR